MSILTPEQIAELADNGLTPEADHVPVVMLETRHGGAVIGGFLLTHINPEHETEAYGLIDFGTGKPRISMIFLDQLKTFYPRYDFAVEANNEFAPSYPISVYAQATRMMGKITPNKPSLQMAATHLELTKAKDQFINPFRKDDGPAFLPMPN